MRFALSMRQWVLASGIALLTGCATRPAPMYMWETFPRQQYDALLRNGASSVEQIRAMEAHAEKARGANAALPPGFRAHLGMLHLATGNADEARRLWEAERQIFPESAPFMGQLLKRLEMPTAAKPENPA